MTDVGVFDILLVPPIDTQHTQSPCRFVILEMKKKWSVLVVTNFETAIRIHRECLMQAK